MTTDASDTSNPGAGGTTDCLPLRCDEVAPADVDERERRELAEAKRHAVLEDAATCERLRARGFPKSLPCLGPGCSLAPLHCPTRSVHSGTWFRIDIVKPHRGDASARINHFVG